MLKPLIFLLFSFISQGFCGIMKHGKNDPHACIVVTISRSNLGNQIWVQELCIDEALRHSKGVF